MTSTLNTLLLFLGVLVLGVPPAGATTAVAPGRTDYSVDAHWLCRPGRDDACAQPLTVTAGDGSAAQALRRNLTAPIDCFYVYPTVSMDATPNSDLVPGAEEARAAQLQLAALGSECRLFAPVYRQVTIAALRSRFTDTPMQANGLMAYGDVVDAWKHYLAHDNQGRGVVLIGHSQGARMLIQLIAREIEGQPVQQRIVAALLLGSNLAVPKGRDMGGDLKAMPLCRSVAQLGCVIAYTAFRAESPPPADTLFGRLAGAASGAADPTGMRVACTHPGALGGGAGTLQALMPMRENLMGQPTPAGGPPMTATFLAVPSVQAQCVETDTLSYLAVQLPPGIAGDLVYNGQVLRNWGLHLVDPNLAMGSLIGLVREKAGVYLRER